METLSFEKRTARQYRAAVLPPSATICGSRPTRRLNKYQWAQKQALLFYEQLLPAFKLKELWHMFWQVVIPTEDWGTLGLSINFINMGIEQFTDELGGNRDCPFLGMGFRVLLRPFLFADAVRRA